jgi:hypothetical protein
VPYTRAHDARGRQTSLLGGSDEHSTEGCLKQRSSGPCGSTSKDRLPRECRCRFVRRTIEPIGGSWLTCAACTGMRISPFATERLKHLLCRLRSRGRSSRRFYLKGSCFCSQSGSFLLWSRGEHFLAQQLRRDGAKQRQLCCLSDGVAIAATLAIGNSSNGAAENFGRLLLRAEEFSTQLFVLQRVHGANLGRAIVFPKYWCNGQFSHLKANGRAKSPRRRKNRFEIKAGRK